MYQDGSERMYQSPESREISIVEVDQAGSVLSKWIRMYQD